MHVQEKEVLEISHLNNHPFIKTSLKNHYQPLAHALFCLHVEAEEGGYSEACLSMNGQMWLWPYMHE